MHVVTDIIVKVLPPVVSVCRGTSGPDGHDEHLDSAERYSSGNSKEEWASAAAEAGPVPEDRSSFRSYVGHSATGVTCRRSFNVFQIVNIYFQSRRSCLLCSFLWHIPLTYKTDASSTVHRHLMTSQTGKS